MVHLGMICYYESAGCMTWVMKLEPGNENAGPLCHAE